MMKLRVLAISALILGAGSALAEPPVGVNPNEINQTPALPHTPAAVKGLRYARPFTLEQGYEFEWRAERPTVKAGWLLVLEVESALVFPRQTAEPILYVGKTTGERVNVGYESGRIVVIVPSDLNDQGEVALDLSEAMMWFGTPGLPEQVDAAKAEAERAAAIAARIAPFSAEAINAARAKTGETLNAANRETLRHAAAELIKIHSPHETDLADLILSEANAAVEQPAGVN